MESNIVFDQDTISFFEDGRRLDLTLIDMRILNLLVQSKDDIVSREDFQKIWDEVKVSERVLDVHISHIRKCLESHRIDCILNQGYCLTNAK